MTQSTWITRTREKPATRLFCFPHAGGGATAFRQWAHKLPPALEVCAIQLPGRETRLIEQPYTQMKQLIPALAQGLQNTFDVPFIFFGHSMGSFIAFELTHYLREQNLPQPEMLIVSASKAPHLPHRAQIMHTKTDQEFLDALEQLGGTPVEVLRNQELMQIFIPMMRADFTLYEQYIYKDRKPLHIPLIVCGGEYDQDVSKEELQAWQQHSDRAFTMHMFAGGHFYLEPCQNQLLQMIAKVLVKS